MGVSLHLSVNPSQSSILEERAEHPASPVHQPAMVLSLSAVKAFLVKFSAPDWTM
jgi:hypothetical protein